MGHLLNMAIKIIAPISIANPNINTINPSEFPMQIPMVTRRKPKTSNITDILVTILSGILFILLS